MEDCTESHQAEINRKIRANDKLRKMLTNMPDELIYGDSLKAKMQSLDDVKVAYWQPKGHSCTCKVGSKNKRITWSESPERLRRNNNIVLKFYKNGSRLTRNWMQHTPNRSKPSMRCPFWWPNKPQKTRRLLIRALQESSHFHQVPTQTQTHNRPSSQCSNLFSVGVLSQNQGSRLSNLHAMWWYWTQSSLRAYLDSAAWTSKAKKPSRGVCRTQPQKRDVWRRSASKKKMSSVSGIGFGSSQYLFTSRFSELAKRRIQVLFALWPMGSEFVQQERSGIGTTVRTIW